MNKYLSKRCANITQSEIRNMSIECDKVNGINLSQGICDLDLPEPVRKGAEEAMIEGINHYTRYDGLERLRKAIAGKMKSFNNINVDPQKEIIVSSGATGAFYSTCLALLNPGDEVILFEPYYGYHLSTLEAVEVVPKFVTLHPPQWSFDIADLEKVVTSRTKAIVINTPTNPCGKVFTKRELELIGDFCVKYDLLIFTDEIYEYFIYDDKKHISPGSIPSVKKKTIIISGYSKTYSITGWRIGYSVSDPELAQMIGYMSDLIYVCAPAPLQIGVAAGIESLPQSYYEDLCNMFKKKRDLLCSALTEVGLTPYVPDGAYYILADASSLTGKSSKDRAMYLLEKTGVGAVPGSAFYQSNKGNTLLRFCFAAEESILQEACERLMKLKKI